jgi:hypothetical protein
VLGSSLWWIGLILNYNQKREWARQREEYEKILEKEREQKR